MRLRYGDLAAEDRVWLEGTLRLWGLSYLIPPEDFPSDGGTFCPEIDPLTGISMTPCFVIHDWGYSRACESIPDTGGGRVFVDAVLMRLLEARGVAEVTQVVVFDGVRVGGAPHFKRAA